MDPPRQIAPIPALFVLICKPWDHNRCPRNRFFTAVIIPDVAFNRVVVMCAVQSMVIAELVQLWRAVSRANSQGAKSLRQWIKQRLTKRPPMRNRKVRIGGDVRNAVYSADFGMQKIPHEEIAAQAHAPQSLQPAHGSWTAHHIPQTEARNLMPRASLQPRPVQSGPSMARQKTGGLRP